LKIFDVVLHPDLPPADSVLFGFGVRFKRGPALDKHTKYGDDGSGPIGTAFAMDKNGMILFVAYQLDNLENMFVARRPPIAQMKIDEPDTVFFGRAPFTMNPLAGVAEIYDRSYAEFLQFCDAFKRRLSAPKQEIGYAMKIRKMFPRRAPAANSRQTTLH
jgi:hypothetical protein